MIIFKCDFCGQETKLHPNIIWLLQFSFASSLKNNDNNEEIVEKFHKNNIILFDTDTGNYYHLCEHCEEKYNNRKSAIDLKIKKYKIGLINELRDEMNGL
jgi:hypothetical protein